MTPSTRDLDELRTHWREDVRFEPRMPEDERERRYRQWGKAVSKSLDWVTTTRAC